MSHQVRCPCGGNPDCKLCRGTKFYEYEPGPRGWMPFTCPTCEGKREVTIGAATAWSGAPGFADDRDRSRVPTEGQTQRCFTCLGVGSIDPALPPRDTSTRGLFRDLWRIFFGG